VLEGGLGRIAVGESRRGVLGCDEGGRYRCGMWLFSNGSSACNSVRSRVVEYLNDSHQKPPNGAWCDGAKRSSPEMRYFKTLKRI
jgi:hypothetical protein